MPLGCIWLGEVKVRRSGMWLPPFEEGGDVVAESAYVVEGVVGAWWEEVAEVWVFCEE